MAAPIQVEPASGINPNYLITLQARPTAAAFANRGIDTVTLQTTIPDNFTISFGTDWQSQFANAMEDILGKIPGRTGQIVKDLSTAGGAVGLKTQSKVMSAMIWQGTSSLDLQIPFILRAEKDPVKEILEPIKNLAYLSLPSEKAAGLMLEAPFNPAQVAMGMKAGMRGVAGKSAISVQIGRFFYMPNCVITNIQHSYDTFFDAQGRPLSVKVDVTLKSFFVITVEDVEEMFPLTPLSALRK